MVDLADKLASENVQEMGCDCLFRRRWRWVKAPMSVAYYVWALGMTCHARAARVVTASEAEAALRIACRGKVRLASRRGDSSSRNNKNKTFSSLSYQLLPAGFSQENAFLHGAARVDTKTPQGDSTDGLRCGPLE